jgi:hypothetical protein
LTRVRFRKRAFQITGFGTCLLAILLASGGHWMALQSIAWARMLLEYSRTDSLVAAMEKTFDGRHPCCMCRRIQEARRQEQRQKPPLLKWEKQRELWLEARRVSVPLPPVPGRHATAFVADVHSDFVITPPKPPPRAA